MHFDAAYRERATLLDGRVVELRLIRPEDKPLLVRAFERQSPESRYRRFFQEKDKLSEWELRYLTEVDGVTHFAIGATEALPGGEEGRGVARFVRLRERPDTAEWAIAVDDEVHGLGLGRLLLQRLCAAAKERGIAQLRCEVLAFNEPMRAMMENLAPNAKVEEDGAVVALEFPVPQVAPDEPPDEAERQNPLYRVMVLAAGGAIAIRRAFDRLIDSLS